MTIKTALKKLHEKMTGKAATKNTAAALIDELADNYTGGGGTGGGGVDSILALLLLADIPTMSGYDDGGPFHFIDIRIPGQAGSVGQMKRGGMDNITAEELHAQIITLAEGGDDIPAARNKAAKYLYDVFYNEAQWYDDELLAIVKTEGEDTVDLFTKIAAIIANNHYLSSRVASYYAGNHPQNMRVIIDNGVANYSGKEIYSAVLAGANVTVFEEVGDPSIAKPFIISYVRGYAVSTDPEGAEYAINLKQFDDNFTNKVISYNAHSDDENGKAVFTRNE